MEPESQNAAEEAKEIVEKCINCGMCKALCPVFSVMLEEALSPRGKAILLNSDVYDKILYECTLCKACEQKCPLDIKLCEAFRKARNVLAANNKETEANKEMIKNIRAEGNPFGKEKGRERKLYCC